jgi:hypothetical protein
MSHWVLVLVLVSGNKNQLTAGITIVLYFGDNNGMYSSVSVEQLNFVKCCRAGPLSLWSSSSLVVDGGSQPAEKECWYYYQLVLVLV